MGRWKGAGEVTLLQNANATQSKRARTGSGDAAGLIQLQHADACLDFSVSQLLFEETEAHRRHTPNEAICKQWPEAVRRLGSGALLAGKSPQIAARCQHRHLHGYRILQHQV